VATTIEPSGRTAMSFTEMLMPLPTDDQPLPSQRAMLSAGTPPI
jgi:hypothetical protein